VVRRGTAGFGAAALQALTPGGRPGRGVSGGLAVTAALCAVAALPGAATADPGDLPGYRTAEDAQEVVGAASSADGPRLQHGETYTDRIAPGQQKYYTVKLDSSSQPRISAVALPEPGSEVSSDDGITLTLEATDGTECVHDVASFDYDGVAWPLVAWVARLAEQDGNCQDGGVYNLSVTRQGEDAADQTAWRIELDLMREPGLRAAGPTEAPEVEETPTELPQMPTRKPQDIQGGTGFNDAPGMGEGVWKDRLRPGETRFYRVPVDWNQRLALRAEFGTTRVTDEDGVTSDGVQVEFYSPARAHVTGRSGTFWAGEPAALSLLTPPVTYGFRYSYDSGLAAASVAGWYYVAVRAHPGLDAFVRGKVPVTLRTEFTGRPASGPDYAGDASAAGFGVSQEDRDQAAAGLTPQAAERRDTLAVVGWAGIGAGTVLVAGLGLWALLARRGAVEAAGHGTAVPAAGPGPYGTSPSAAPGHGQPQGRR
jgi:hypothetical protein